MMNRYATGICAVLAAMTPVAATAQETPEAATIIAMEDARFAAQVAADVPALEAAIAPDALYIHANGVVQDRDTYLASVRAGKSHYRAIEASDRDVVPLSADTLVTHATVTLHVGVDKTINTRATGVYTLRGGKWLLVSWQSTPVTAPTP